MVAVGVSQRSGVALLHDVDGDVVVVHARGRGIDAGVPVAAGLAVAVETTIMAPQEATRVVGTGYVFRRNLRHGTGTRTAVSAIIAWRREMISSPYMQGRSGILLIKATKPCDINTKKPHTARTHADRRLPQSYLRTQNAKHARHVPLPSRLGHIMRTSNSTNQNAAALSPVDIGFASVAAPIGSLSGGHKPLTAPSLSARVYARAAGSASLSVSFSPQAWKGTYVPRRTRLSFPQRCNVAGRLSSTK